MAVHVVDNTWIPFADGTRLAAKLWLPEDAEARPVPAILEYLPYRKNDGTALQDADRHTYFARHGYAAVRVDLRGTGDSDGISCDEYLPREQDDALEVLSWLAERPWCSGTVGMIGYSWGGFNGLQIAARRPPELGAVVSAYSTDDRYLDDCHFMGGCVLGSDMLKWATSMRAYNALPPDPRFREDWSEVWLERLDKTPAFIEQWLAYQIRDAYWEQGSVDEEYGAIVARRCWSVAGPTPTRTPCRGSLSVSRVSVVGSSGPGRTSCHTRAFPARRSTSSVSACAGSTGGSRASTRAFNATTSSECGSKTPWRQRASMPNGRAGGWDSMSGRRRPVRACASDWASGP